MFWLGSSIIFRTPSVPKIAPISIIVFCPWNIPLYLSPTPYKNGQPYLTDKQHYKSQKKSKRTGWSEQRGTEGVSTWLCHIHKSLDRRKRERYVITTPSVTIPPSRKGKTSNLTPGNKKKLFPTSAYVPLPMSRLLWNHVASRPATRLFQATNVCSSTMVELVALYFIYL